MLIFMIFFATFNSKTLVFINFIHLFQQIVNTIELDRNTLELKPGHEIASSFLIPSVKVKKIFIFLQTCQKLTNLYGRRDDVSEIERTSNDLSTR